MRGQSRGVCRPAPLLCEQKPGFFAIRAVVDGVELAVVEVSVPAWRQPGRGLLSAGRASTLRIARGLRGISAARMVGRGGWCARERHALAKEIQKVRQVVHRRRKRDIGVGRAALVQQTHGALVCRPSCSACLPPQTKERDSAVGGAGGESGCDCKRRDELAWQQLRSLKQQSWRCTALGYDNTRTGCAVGAAIRGIDNAAWAIRPVGGCVRCNRSARARPSRSCRPRRVRTRRSCTVIMTAQPIAKSTHVALRILSAAVILVY